jgi:hypothetical protein
MNEVQLHFLFNHLPIIGTMVGVITLAWGVIAKNQSVLKTGLVIVLATSLFTFPAFFTGEGAEEIVEEFPGISHDVIHEHEEKAEVFIWLSGALALISLMSIVSIQRGMAAAKRLTLLSLILGLIAVISGSMVAHSGGLIRHPEINNEKPVTEPSAQSDSEEKDH